MHLYYKRKYFSGKPKRREGLLAAGEGIIKSKRHGREAYTNPADCLYGGNESLTTKNELPRLFHFHLFLDGKYG